MEFRSIVLLNFIKEYKNGKDLALVIEKQVEDFEKASRTKEPEINEADHKYQAKMLRYGKQIDLYLKREESYKDNLSRLYGLIYGQCTPTMIAGVKSQPDYTAKNEVQDVVWLLKTVKKLSIGIDSNENEANIALDVH